MRTTVDIPDPKYRLLKSRAAAQGKTVKELVMRGVDVILAEETAAPRRRPRFPLIHSKQPGKLNIDNERIYDIIGFP
ncbi:MAG: hypothetical protein JWM43_1609 [Acidobacteriaceae bacterium]|nr:hypothetical protein [Acidobacteriaceae bacterium]